MVMISYTHDDDAHKLRVLALADRLRSNRVDCELDQYNPNPAEGWPSWMNNTIRDSKFVLVVCTKEYYEAFEGFAAAGKRTGGKLESQLTKQYINDNDSKNEKFLPLIFDNEDAEFVPTLLKPYTRYCVKDEKGYLELYRRLTDQPAIVKPPLGTELVLEVGLNITKGLVPDTLALPVSSKIAQEIVDEYIKDEESPRKMLSPIQTLVRAYLSLSEGNKSDIAHKLGLEVANEIGAPLHTRDKKVFTEVKEKNLTSDLWEEVFKILPNSTKNPFKA